MSEFTKGMWEIVDAGPQQDERQLFWGLHIFSGARHIAEIAQAPDVDYPTVKANARLIVAAPEMYDELYETLQLLKGKSSWDGDEFSVQARSIQELMNRINGKEVRNNE